MKHEFWHEKWAKNEIAFHQEKPHPWLERYLVKMDLRPGHRIFVPLCGKTLDIHWLLAQGFRVVGAELNESAVEQLFAELKLDPEIRDIDGFRHYSAENTDIFVGDIFALSQKRVGRVDAVYDRAALVALPEDMRPDYARQILALSKSAPQFLICFTYDQSKLDGPPFSISNDELRELYGATFRLRLAARDEVKGGLKGQCPAEEKLWLLTE